MQANWILATKQAPAENTEVVVLVRVLGMNNKYTQVLGTATYSKEGRYETTTRYFQDVTYYIPFSRDVDLDPPEGFATFTKLASLSAKPETGDDPEIIYVVRMEYEGRVTFSTAYFKNGKWGNLAGTLSHVTHAAPLARVPKMPQKNTSDQKK